MIPENIDAIFSWRMKNDDLAILIQNEFRKWLRFYLDPANHETPAQFMQKLNEKGQSPEKQKQAAQCVKVYLNIIASDAIKIRNYLKKTFRTYASWINRFGWFDDVKRFLTDLAVNRNVAATTQNQAFNALLYLFRHILGRPDEFMSKAVSSEPKTKNTFRSFSHAKKSIKSLKNSVHLMTSLPSCSTQGRLPKIPSARNACAKSN